MADLQLSGMEESAEAAACNYQNVKRLTHFQDYWILKLSHLGIARSPSRPPLACSFQRVSGGQQTFFNRHLIKKNRRKVLSGIHDIYMIFAPRTRFWGKFCFTQKYINCDKLDFAPNQCNPHQFSQKVGENFFWQLKFKFGKPWTIWNSHLWATAFGGSLGTAFWWGRICSSWCLK